MAKPFKDFYKLGETEDGRPVFGNWFRLRDTEGLPISVMLQLANKYQVILSPIAFYEEAKYQGWKDKTIFDRLKEAYQDAYNHQYWEQVKIRLDAYLELRGNDDSYVDTIYPDYRKALKMVK